MEKLENKKTNDVKTNSKNAYDKNLNFVSILYTSFERGKMSLYHHVLLWGKGLEPSIFGDLLNIDINPNPEKIQSNQKAANPFHNPSNGGQADNMENAKSDDGRFETDTIHVKNYCRSALA